MKQKNRSEKPDASAALTIRKLLEFKRVGDLSVSPDGRQVVASVLTSDLAQNKETTQLWLFDQDGNGRVLSPSDASFTHPRFSADGRSLACLAKRNEDKENQIYLLSLDGEDPQRVTNVPTGVINFKWNPSGQSLVFLTRIWRDLDSWEAQQERLEMRNSGRAPSAMIYDHAPVLDWDHFIDDRESHVFMIQLSDHSITPITILTNCQLPRWTGGPFATVDYDISPDGKHLAFVADSGANKGRRQDQIMLLEIGTCQPIPISCDPTVSDSTPLFSPDGKQLAFLRMPATRFWGAHRRIAYRTLDDSKALHVLNEDWDRSIRALRWTPDSQGFMGLVDDDGLEKLYHFPTGEAPHALTHEGSIVAYDMARHGSMEVVYGIHSCLTKVASLVRIETASGTITSHGDLNSALNQNVRWGSYELVSYRGADDHEIQMWINYPPDFDPQKTYPLLIMIHGGPFAPASDRMSILLPLQVYAAAGFVVAYPNFHGSTGFGLEFTQSIANDYATRPYTDIIKAARFMAEKPWIDSDRMIAGGGSYGGYLSLILLGRDHPFKALINICGLFNLFSQYGSDYAFEEPTYDDYWVSLQSFLDHSPHMAVDHFKTPLLIGHGLQDRRVPLNHPLELFHILQRRGIPSRLICYQDEHHWFLKPQNNVHWNEEMIAWMRKYTEKAIPGPVKQGRDV